MYILCDRIVTQVNANIDEEIVRKFRHIIYTRDGLKKGDFKNALEEAMLGYIQKYSTASPEVRKVAKTDRLHSVNSG